MITINTMEDLIRILDERPEWVEALRARLLTRELLELPQNFARFVEEMNKFRAEMNRFVTATNKRLDNIDARLDGHDARFDKIDTRLDGIDTRLDGHDARFDKIDTRLDGIDARLDGHDARFDKIDTRLDGIDARLDGIDTRLDGIDTRLDGHDARFDKIDARLDGIDARLDGHDARFDKIDVTIQKIRDDLTPLKGAHARNAALEDAIAIARDMGLWRTKTLTREDIWDLTDSADTANIPTNELRSFRRADLIMETTGQDREICYIAVEISFTANGRDTTRAIRNAGFLTRFTGKRSYAAVAGLYRDERIQDSIESGEVFWHQLEPEQLGVE